MEYRWQCSDALQMVPGPIRLLRDSQGNPQESFGCWLDITERKQAEEAAKTANAASANCGPYTSGCVREDRNGRLSWQIGLRQLLLDANRRRLKGVQWSNCPRIENRLSDSFADDICRNRSREPHFIPEEQFTCPGICSCFRDAQDSLLRCGTGRARRARRFT